MTWSMQGRKFNKGELKIVVSIEHMFSGHPD